VIRRLPWVALSAVLLLGCGKPADDAPQPRTPPDGDQPFQVKFETTKGDFVVKVRPDWAPHGAKRFRQLVESGFYDGCKFFRVVPGFMVQFGISGDPTVSAEWRDRTMPDDPVAQSNIRGTVTFATSGPSSRTTQVFVNFGDNSRLDSQGFAPFGTVVKGMDVVDSINAEYLERPSQPDIQAHGNVYLEENFPNLDGIQRATIVTDAKEPEPKKPE
jgi:cyclophilin family peptidyl-prolyl cis-trans isomerase